MIRHLHTILMVLLTAFSAGAAELQQCTTPWGLKAEEVFSSPPQLHLARTICENNLDKIARSVEKGAGINDIGNKGVTPLKWSVMLGNNDATRRLLQLGADPNRVDAGYNAVDIAAELGNPDILTILLEHGGDANSNTGHFGALTLAVRALSLPTVKVLVEHGADVNRVNEVGWSAAMDAVALGQFDVVKYFLENGYNTNLELLSRAVQNRIVPANGQAAMDKKAVIKILAEQGY